MFERRNEASPASQDAAGAAASRGLSTGHFWLGVVIFVGVALAYPFYAYRVQQQLVAQAVPVVAVEAPPQAARMTAAEERQTQIAAREAAERAALAAPQAVTVTGATRVGRARTVMVQFGESSLPEAQAAICQQAAALLLEAVDGEELKVQRDRGKEPAVDVGTITCD